jgi:RNA polymerase sigma factor (sigma-70 family)
VATAAIAHETIALTVAALQSNWAIPNPVQTPAASPGLILPFIWACEDEDDHEDETDKVKLAGPASSSPGPWLSEGIVDSLRSDQIPLKLTKAEQSRYQRLRMAQESFREYRHHGLHTTQGVNFGFDLNDEMFAEELAKEPSKDLDTEQYAFEKEGPQAGADDEVDAEDEEAGEVDPDTEEITEFEVAVVGNAAGDKELDAAYLAWSKSPGLKAQGEFFTVLYAYVQTRYGHSKVAAKLYQADEIENGASDLAMTLLATLGRMLTRGEVLREQACKYVSKAMSESRKGTVNDLAKRQKNTLQDEYTESEGDESHELSLLDDVVNAGWLQGRNDSAPDYEFKEDIQDERKVWLRQQIETGSLPPELRALAALYYLEEKTQVECGEELGITQGAISKQLTRVRDYVAAKRKVSK